VTCIIGHRDGWMVSDRRKTFQDHLLGPYQVEKIIRGPGLLLATSGAGVLGDLAREAIAKTKTTQAAAKAVVQLFREKVEGHALVLTADMLAEITSTGELCKLQSRYWAIGSGYMVALGYLGALERTRSVTPEDAIAAIELASTLVSDVGDGVHVVAL
jgi:ATP-dependent protease HslVU (ClpYQ) peptidase subunit